MSITYEFYENVIFIFNAFVLSSSNYKKKIESEALNSICCCLTDLGKKELKQ